MVSVPYGADTYNINRSFIHEMVFTAIMTDMTLCHYITALYQIWIICCQILMNIVIIMAYTDIMILMVYGIVIQTHQMDIMVRMVYGIVTIIVALPAIMI